MIIQCPKCNARFLVPDAAIGANGRNVKCGRCSNQWFFSPPPGAITPDADKDLPDINSLINEINTRPKPIPKGSNLPVKMEPVPLSHKLTMAVLVLLALGLGLLIAAPGTLNMPSSKGLVLADVGVVRLVDKDKHLSFQISGKIANTSATALRIPTLRITLVDNEGKSLQYWDFTGDTPTLDAHKDIPFATGDLDIRFSKGNRFVAELGSPLELALRRKP